MKTRSVAIGFGQGISRDGKLSRLSEGVADTISVLFEDKAIDKAIVTGNRTFRLDHIPSNKLKSLNFQTEAQGMRERLLQRGIPDWQIEIEVRAKDTVANACFSKQIILELDVNRIFVVAPGHHLERVAITTAFVMGPKYKIIPVGSPDDFTKEELLKIKKAEKASLEGTFYFLNKYGRDIKSGDHEEILRVLYLTMRTYNEKAVIDDEDQKVIDKIALLRKNFRKYSDNPDLKIRT